MSGRHSDTGRQSGRNSKKCAHFFVSEGVVDSPRARRDNKKEKTYQSINSHCITHKRGQTNMNASFYSVLIFISCIFVVSYILSRELPTWLKVAYTLFGLGVTGTVFAILLQVVLALAKIVHILHSL